MRNIILLTKPDGEHLAYGSILALLDDPDNPVQVSEQYFHRLAKEGGWPVQHSGCVIEKLPLLNSREARSKETKSRML